MADLSPGDTVTVNFPGNGLHGKRVRVERIDPALDLAHPDCPERLLCEMLWVSHPTLPWTIGLSRERIRR
jgi:hypothetical protein